MSKTSHFIAFMAIALAIPCPGVRATSWIGPFTMLVHSRDGNVLVRIDPPDGKKKRSEDNCPIATISRYDTKRGEYLFVRRTRLRNSECPGEALVTNDGRHLVTLDEHNSGGWTENAVVIYDFQLGSVTNLSVEAFLPASHRNELEYSSSGTAWRVGQCVNEWDGEVIIWSPKKKSDRSVNLPDIFIKLATKKITLVPRSENSQQKTPQEEPTDSPKR